MTEVAPRPTVATRTAVAFVREQDCIGCFRCVKVCPESAILGASRYTHTVITALCTGCEDCLPSCPVDCIEMVPPP